MVKMLTGASEAKRSDRRSHCPLQEDSDSDDKSSSQEDKKLRGAARAFNRYRKSKDAMWRKPMKHVRIYIKEIETELGVEGGDLPYKRYQPVGLHEEDPVWQAEGLFRCHFLVSYILKHLLDDDKESAALMAVLTLRCLQQVALDSGNWMLTTLKDLLSRRRWGGEPGHVETAADLEKRTRQVTWGNLDQNPNETADTPDAAPGWWMRPTSFLALAAPAPSLRDC